MRVYRHHVIKDGQRVEIDKYYLDLRVEGRRHRIPLYSSKTLSTKAAEKIGHLLSCKLAGEPPTPALQEWLKQQPPAFVERLAKAGLISEVRLAAKTDIERHLNDWLEALAASGITQKQINLLAQRVRRVLDECNIGTLADINPDKILAAVQRLRRIVYKKNAGGEISPAQTKPISSRSKLFYLRAVKQFLRWLEMNGRLDENPLRRAQIKNVITAKPRRALTVEEIRWLLAYCQTAPTVWGLDGQTRGLIYELAVYSGLRAGELRALRKRDFDFEARQVRLHAAHTKNKRQAILPLKSGLSERLRLYLMSKTPEAAAFKIPQNINAIFVQDLQAARRAYIEAARHDPAEYDRRANSDFLADNAAGKLTFHSLRHTFATFLVSTGAPVKTAQTLLRHSTAALTMDVYAHLQQSAEMQAVEALPDLEIEPLLSAGVDKAQ